MAKKIKGAEPAFQALGRVARALTYPAIGAEYDMTLRELNALATVAHVNEEFRITATASKDLGRVDTFDGMHMMPGYAQAFWDEAQFIEATDNLAELGLVTVETTQGLRLMLRGAEGPGRIVRLTDAGRELADAMAGNLAKTLSLLDDEEVRKDLALYYS